MNHNTKYKLISTVLIGTFFVMIFSLNAQANSNSKPKTTITKRIQIDYGKPGAPVSLDYTLPKLMVAGQPIILALSFSSNTPKGRLLVEINNSRELQLLSPTQLDFDLVQPMNTQVQLRSNHDGSYHVNINTREVDSNNQALLARSFVIPINIGNNIKITLKTSGEAKESNGEKIIEMISK